MVWNERFFVDLDIANDWIHIPFGTVSCVVVVCISREMFTKTFRQKVNVSSVFMCCQQQKPHHKRRQSRRYSTYFGKALKLYLLYAIIYTSINPTKNPNFWSCHIFSLTQLITDLICMLWSVHHVSLLLGIANNFVNNKRFRKFIICGAKWVCIHYRTNAKSVQYSH